MALFKRNSFIGLRLIILVVISFTLMTIDHRMQGANKIRSTLSMLVTPLVYVADWPSRFAEAVIANISTQHTLLSENAQLRAHQLLLEAKVQKLMALEKENAQLKELLSSSYQLQISKYLVARILADDLPGFADQVILSKGDKDGVYIGQPVLDAYGVFGQVIMVNELTSRVLLITDPHSGVPVKNNRTGMRGIAVGMQYGNRLALLHVTDTSEVMEGDLYVTSGLGLVYPEGYPVGTVKSIGRKPGDQFANIVIEPSAHITRSQEVLLIWPENNGKLADEVRKSAKN